MSINNTDIVLQLRTANKLAKERNKLLEENNLLLKTISMIMIDNIGGVSTTYMYAKNYDFNILLDAIRHVKKED